MTSDSVYLVVHKNENGTYSFFATDSKVACSQANGLLLGHGGSIAVVEITSKEMAECYMNDWMEK